MVRITTIKLNIGLIKFVFFLLLGSLLLLIFISLAFTLRVGSTVRNIDTEVFKKAIDNTVINNNEEININDITSIDTSKIISKAVGFDIKKPETIISKEIAMLDYFDNTIKIVDQSNIEINKEIKKVNDDKVEEEKEEPEVEQKESVINSEGITIINETNYNIDVKNILESKLNIKKTLKGPSVLIYHTHTCEAYTPSKKYKYTSTENDRTNDLNYTVWRVGEELKKNLEEKFGIEVLHDKTIYDEVSYNKAYSKSEKTLKSYLDKYPDISLVIDLHRDAGISNGKKMRNSVPIVFTSTAQVMVVIGTDGRGMSHPFWKENLKLGLNFVNEMNNMYPGLCRGVNLKLGRFNQFLSKNAILIEVGANGNTLDEALNSTKYMAEVISKVLNR